MIFRPFLIIGIFLAGPMVVHAQDSVKEVDQLDFAQGLLARGMYDMAILQCQKFIADYPKSASLPKVYLSLGEAYFLSQDFDKAVGTFNQFKQLYPNSDQLPVSLLRLAQIDIQQKKYDDALKELTSIDAQKQLKGEMLQSFDYYTAQAYTGKADNTNALDYFQKASQVDGAATYTAYAFKEIGQIDSKNGQYPQAMDAYTKAMSLASDDALKGELTYRIAQTNFLLGKYDDAIKGFGQVLNQYANLEYAQEALANLLSAYLNAGQYAQLLDEYQKDAAKIKEGDNYFAIQFAVVQANMELKKYDQASALLDSLLTSSSLKPEDKAVIFVRQADILIRQGKFKEAQAFLDAHASQTTGDADEAAFLEAQAYFGLGDYEKAYTFYGTVCSNFPNSRFFKAAVLGQAHSREKGGNYKQAEDLFLKYRAMQEDPALKSEALYDSVITAVQAGDFAGAVSGGQEYLKEFPKGEKSDDVLLLLADSFGKNKQPQDAVNLLQTYLAAQPVQKPNSANFLLGFNQQLLGKNDEALAAYALVDPQKEDGKFYPTALKNIAIIYLLQKKEDQARDTFDKLISLADQSDLKIDTYVWVCNQYLKQQKYNDVLRIAQAAEKHFTGGQDLKQIKYFEGEAQRGLGKCDEAAQAYNLVTASPQKDVYTGSAHIGQGLCLADAKKFDEATQEFQKALDENADDFTVTVHARFEMANAAMSQGKFDDALKLYLLVATIYDDDYYCSESLLRAAKINEQQQHKADALKLYSEILAKYPKSTAAPYAKERVPLLK
jgi:tetratricopeptide (TPR) repeat protein